ncbi:MarR family transcriptional regulator [Metabacillus fastidiosus]|uniref:MarR family transcriptional regulator n=1 Tax=Metabacillus fastidiosus TaxID=1458 RepID=A0ABU6NZD8_9BACI|nr:MarR family transcriptional regulator [Metabacillus fastidiosus]
MKEKISEHVGVLIHSVDLEITNYLKNQLSPFYLAPEQHLLIALLLEQEGQSQNEIAKKLGKDKSSVTRMIVSLEKKGYIRRLARKNDRRSVQVYLTEEGRALKDIVNQVSDDTKKLLEKGFTNEEISELKRLLTKIQNNLFDE